MFEFKSIPNLRSLSLNNNLITDITDEINDFGLEELYLNRNNVSSLMFLSYLKKLNILELKHNRIKTIAEKIIPSSLLVINLSYNKIVDIHPNAFDNFSNPDNSSEINTFIELNIPIKIDLSFNKIKHLNKDLFGDQNKKLQPIISLILNNNQIDQLEINQFVSLKNLQALNISNNQIKIIRTHTFNGFNRLLFLSLDNNKISSIEKESFKDLTSLFALHLKNNQIEKIEHNWLVNYQPSTLAIDLSFNQIETISNQELTSFKDVSSLNLSHNNLKNRKRYIFEFEY